MLREYEKETGITVSTLYSTGGGTLFPCIDKYLKEILGRDVVIVDPFSIVA